MKTFKITNITNLLGKRSFKQNSELEAEYVDGMIKKTLKIKPQETVYLSLQSLPLSIHRLRIKGLVTVTELAAKEIKAIVAENKRKNMALNADVEEKPKKTTKKSTKKDVEVEEKESKIKEEPKVEEKESKTKEEPKVEEKSVDNSNEKKSTKRTTKKSDSSDTEEKEETKD